MTDMSDTERVWKERQDADDRKRMTLRKLMRDEGMALNVQTRLMKELNAELLNAWTDKMPATGTKLDLVSV